VTGGERVLVVPRELAMPSSWRGLRTDPQALATLVAVIEAHGRFEPRAAVEEDPSLKQIIPYLVLRDGERWFLMRRTRAGADARLHDRWSIGVGGHLNPGDRDLAGGLRREWAEELRADFEPEFQPVGLLNDDETAVGSVHLGVVYVAEAGGRVVAIRETDKLSGAFAEPVDVGAVRDRMETWSQLVFDALAGSPTSARSSARHLPGPAGYAIGRPGPPAPAQG
jgi:predicted NUDIX family phosphoesterase